MSDSTPSAAEIEAAVERAQHLIEYYATDTIPDRLKPTERLQACRVLLHLHASIATLTARAEAAEAFIDKCIKQGSCDDGSQARRYLGRAEALAARIAELEADRCASCKAHDRIRRQEDAALAPKEPV